jgi:hypothetical protein
LGLNEFEVFRQTTEQKQGGEEMAVRIERIVCTVLHKTREKQLEEAMETLSEGPERFYG